VSRWKRCYALGPRSVKRKKCGSLTCLCAGMSSACGFHNRGGLCSAEFLTGDQSNRMRRLAVGYGTHFVSGKREPIHFPGPARATYERTSEWVEAVESVMVTESGVDHCREWRPRSHCSAGFHAHYMQAGQINRKGVSASSALTPCVFWCRRGESNSHGRKAHWILSLVIK
jgi:hypothetical protein